MSDFEPTEIFYATLPMSEAEISAHITEAMPHGTLFSITGSTVTFASIDDFLKLSTITGLELEVTETTVYGLEMFSAIFYDAE